MLRRCGGYLFGYRCRHPSSRVRQVTAMPPLTRSVDKWQKQVTSSARDEEEAHMSLRWSPHRTRHAPAACAGLAIGTVLVLSGCSGGGHGGSAQSASTAPVPPPPTQTSSSPPSDVRAQVLAQYRAFWQHLTPASRASAGTRQKTLAPYASDPELKSLLAGMARGDRAETVFYGEDQPRPTIAQLSIPQGLAVIRDCQDSSHSGNADRRTGRHLTVGVARHLVIATMHVSGGTWRVAFVSYKQSKC